MPPELALILCGGLIFFMLWYDSRTGLNISGTIWIPLIWMMIIGSRFIGQWLNLEAAASMEEGSVIDRIIFSILIICSIIILIKRKINWCSIFFENKWFFIFLFYCFFSIFWSDYPFVSFKRYIKEIGNVLMVLVVITEKDSIEAIKAMIRRSAYVLIPLSIVLIKYYPHLGREFSFWTGEAYNIGVATSKNMLGNLCLITGLYFVWDFFLNRNLKTEENAIKTSIKMDNMLKLLMISMILWLLYKAQSSTSIMCFFIAFLISLISKNSNFVKNPNFLLKTIAFIIFLSIGFEFMFSLKDTIYTILGKEETLTGRSELWQDLLSQNTNPVIGTGYESFWLGERLEAMWEKYWWNPTGSHNGYIEIYLNLGFIGVLLLGCVIVSALHTMLKNCQRNYSYGILQLMIILVTLIYNITEVAFKGTILVWFVFMLVIIQIKISEIDEIRKDFQKTMA